MAWRGGSERRGGQEFSSPAAQQVIVMSDPFSTAKYKDGCEER